MSVQVSPRTLRGQGSPTLLWKNRRVPYHIASINSAHSGRVSMVKTAVSGLIGSPMIVEYTLAKRGHLATWLALIDSNPFATTSLASYFSTGYTVIFNPQNPITWDNMVLKGPIDIDQSIFDATSLDYKPGFDYWQGILSLIITT
jgi:hypothetical protein